jgi:hypothetical protein
MIVVLLALAVRREVGGACAEEITVDLVGFQVALTRRHWLDG